MLCLCLCFLFMFMFGILTAVCGSGLVRSREIVYIESCWSLKDSSTNLMTKIFLVTNSKHILSLNFTRSPWHFLKQQRENLSGDHDGCHHKSAISGGRQPTRKVLATRCRWWWTLHLTPRLDRSQSLFFFVPQVWFSQSSWLDYYKSTGSTSLCYIFLFSGCCNK